MRRRLALLIALLAAAAPSTASAVSVPEWAYTGPFTDPSAVDDVAKRTKIGRAHV